MPMHSDPTAPKPGTARQPFTPRLESLPPAYFFAPDLEREINALDSVTSARVLSIGTTIDEIHVIAPRSLSPKKIVRDIESLLLVRFGIRIDHRCISVVQLDQLQTMYPRYVRPQIQQVSRADGGVHLTLAVGDNVIVGHAKFTEPDEELDSVGRAVIHAVEQLLQTPGVLALLQADIAEMNGYQIALVLARWLFGDQQELLIGASMVHADRADAIARATLDAINRRLVRFQSK